MGIVPSIMLGAALAALAVFGLSAHATLRHLRARRRPTARQQWPSLSILKPLKGIEEGLEENLRSFYEQDYPGPVEVVFASTDPDDPALAVAAQVASMYPTVPSRFVFSDPTYGLNPKVANLAGAVGGARYDLVLQSDANVRAQSDYARSVVDELLREDAQLLSSLVVGTGERSIGAALHNLQLSAFTAPACCLALRYFGVAVVIGKSMLFRKEDLERVGGLDSVRDVLAEDYILGRTFHKAGKKVVLSAMTAKNVNERASVEHFLSRHARWLKMRAVIHIPSFVLDLLANPTAFSLLAVAFSGFNPWVSAAAISLIATKTALDAYVVWRVRGHKLSLRYALLAPVRDLMMLGIWPYAALSRTVEWRGARFRMGWNSRLRPDPGFLGIRWARRVSDGS